MTCRCVGSVESIELDRAMRSLNLLAIAHEVVVDGAPNQLAIEQLLQEARLSFAPLYTSGAHAFCLMRSIASTAALAMRARGLLSSTSAAAR